MLDFVNLMNINFNNKNNRYYVIFFMLSVFSAIVFFASYKDVQSVFANPPVMDQNQMQTMMKQMNKTGMMMAGQQPPMMGPMMMVDPNQMQTMIQHMMDQTMMQHMMDPSHMQTMMQQMNKTGMMMGPMMGATNK